MCFHAFNWRDYWLVQLKVGMRDAIKQMKQNKFDDIALLLYIDQGQ